MRLSYFIIILSLFLLGSCSEYNKVLKSNNYQKKFEFAKELYNENEYSKALPLFDELLSYYRATDKSEDLYYNYAYCQYGVGNNLMAAFRFKTYYETFPNGDHAEECLYMYAYCLKLDSPPIELEQTTSYRALDAFRLFANRYPYSERIP